MIYPWSIHAAPSHFLLPHVPRNVLLEVSLHDFPMDHSKADQFLRSFFWPFLKMSATFASPVIMDLPQTR